jgi:2,6-dihydroxypseudooxynicotine hydrolase
MRGVLRRPLGVTRPPLVVVIPGLDATKEEMHTFGEVFLERGMATLSFDGPGQGETGTGLPIQPDYSRALAAFLDQLAHREDLEMTSIGVVGVSLGGYYAPQAAADEPRVTAAVAICGPFNWGECFPGLPPLTQAAYVYNSGAPDYATAAEWAFRLSLDGVAERIRCPLLVIHAGQDRVIPASEGRRLAQAVPGAELVVYPDGVHVCHNLTYAYRPLVADWMADRLAEARRASPPRT